MKPNVQRSLLYTLAALLWMTVADAQGPQRWQQSISYDMEAQLNSINHTLQGMQTIRYKNNSPDTLGFFYLHLYWNAFQPNSHMDVRSRELGTKVIGRSAGGVERYDWDPRVRDRISKLAEDEQGSCAVTSLTIGGRPQKMEVFGSILKVYPDKPLLPGSVTEIKTRFTAKVPVQIRRSGRNNAEGVAYSMSQWYPKMSAYDEQGWHPTQYVAREFYGVWGDYTVKLTMDKNLKVGATGVLQNAAAIGWGYDKERTPLKPVNGDTRTWIFKGERIHDFVWAADTDYTHITRKPNGGGPLLHFIYKSSERNDQLWAGTADTCAMAYPFMAKTFGPYPWPVYSFIQGGDGGMEYAMATLVKNHGLGTALHEWMHSWYQQLLATNEGLYAWMDEGFTSFAESLIMHQVRGLSGNPWTGEYEGYIGLAKSKLEEPMSTHADHFATNSAYGRAAYSKGGVFMAQLGYLLGDSLMYKTILDYYNLWKFRHPNPNDFIRVAEKASGAELDWYKEYMVYTTKTIDYAVDSLWSEGAKSYVRIRRIGEMPMPVELTLRFKDSTTELHYVPLDLMYWKKTAFGVGSPVATYPAQPWTHRLMTISTDRRLTDILTVEIDAAKRMADIDRKNNRLELSW